MNDTISLQLDEQTAQQMLSDYGPYALGSSQDYIRQSFQLEKTRVTLYQSNKVVFQGRNAKRYATNWGYHEKEEKQAHEKKREQNLPLIGSDEVGNGSYFGGLAVVASFVTPDDFADLRQLGVDDSKKLSDKQILEIAPLLEERIPHQSLLLSPSKYNNVIASGYNAVSIKVALHNQAIYLLLKKGFTPKKIVIDAFTTQKRYQDYLTKEKNHFANPITLETKAESDYLAVAVSSIIARKLFLDNLAFLSDSIGFDLPSGAGEKSDQVASQILKYYGLDGLNKTAKLHFKNTEKAQRLRRQL